MNRDAFLTKVRTALAPRGDGVRRAPAIEQRLAVAPRHKIPARAMSSRPELLAQFSAYLREQSAAVTEVFASADIPAALGRYLEDNALPLSVRFGTDPFLAALPWAAAPALTVAVGPTSGDVGISHALAGVAETGTLLLASGADNPTTLAFLPETHIVVIAEDLIVGGYEDAFDLMRARLGKARMPRSLNLISGPSRTGDIGGRIVLGAHGPRRLAVIIYRR
jgi:L-lactate dehydrogenase complex protein LldG